MKAPKYYNHHKNGQHNDIIFKERFWKEWFLTIFAKYIDLLLSIYYNYLKGICTGGDDMGKAYSLKLFGDNIVVPESVLSGGILV